MVFYRRGDKNVDQGCGGIAFSALVHGAADYMERVGNPLGSHAVNRLQYARPTAQGTFGRNRQKALRRFGYFHLRLLRRRDFPLA